MNIIYLPKEIISIILNNLGSIKQFIEFKTISLYIKDLVESIHWHNEVVVHNNVSLQFFTTRAKLTYITIDYSCTKEDFLYLRNCEKICFCTTIYIKENELGHLTSCTYLHLKNSTVNDESLQYISKTVKTVYLSSTKITNDALKYLSHCKHVYIDGTGIGGEEIRHLSGCKTISFACTKISDDDLYHVRDCTSLDLLCTQITDKGLVHLSNCHHIILSLTKITNEGLKYLTACSNLNLRYSGITDEGLKYIGKKCTVLDLSNTKVTDEGLYYIQHVPDICLSYTKITNTGLLHLLNCKKLTLTHTKVTLGGIKRYIALNEGVKIMV
jgi:hypothetical protein